jgi:hypothetical protein
MSRTVIPKDCIVCDFCNKATSDGEFVATCDQWWWEGWLQCDDCHAEKPDEKYGKLIMEIKKGQDLADTDLSHPIVITSGDDTFP